MLLGVLQNVLGAVISYVHGGFRYSLGREINSMIRDARLLLGRTYAPIPLL